MSIWAEIKKALNSTFGTSYFKPLDELVFRNKTLVPSDQVLYQFTSPSGYIYGNSVYEPPEKVRFYNGGLVNFELQARGTSLSGNTGAGCALVVYKNGIEVAREKWSNVTEMATVSVIVNPYDMFSLKIENKYTYGNFTNVFLTIKAETVEAAYEVIE